MPEQMEKDAGHDDMPEFPKLSDVEKEMAMQEATDSLAKAVLLDDPYEPTTREQRLDLLAWYDRHDGFDHVADRSSKTDEALDKELASCKERYWEKFPDSDTQHRHPLEALRWMNPSLTNDPASQAEHHDLMRREAAEEDALSELGKGLIREDLRKQGFYEKLQQPLGENEKVKHCPYCGTPGKASVFSMSNGYFSVLCLTCDARGPKALRTAEAIEKWNNRNFTGG